MSDKLAAAQCQCSKRAAKNLGSSESLLPEADEDGVVDVFGKQFSSEPNLVRRRSSSDAPPPPSRRCASVPDIAHYSADYDDLCGAWPSPDHPGFEHYGDDVDLRPRLCAWTFVTIRDAERMRRRMFDRDAIKFIIEQKLPDCAVFRDEGREVFWGLAWEIFKYMRDNDFSGKGISSVLGLFYSTHRFFLSTRWRSARETCDFFRVGVELHASLKPPESDLIFNFSECDELIDMFRSLYIRKLELIRSVCIPRYNLILKVNKCGINNEKSLAPRISETQV